MAGRKLKERENGSVPPRGGRHRPPALGAWQVQASRNLQFLSSCHSAAHRSFSEGALKQAQKEAPSLPQRLLLMPSFENTVAGKCRFTVVPIANAKINQLIITIQK